MNEETSTNPLETSANQPEASTPQPETGTAPATDFAKCKMCNVPLNSEIKSDSNPDLCFNCAEETRKFTVNEGQKKSCTSCNVELNEYNTSQDVSVCTDCYAKNNPYAAKGKGGLFGWLKSLFK